MRLRAVCQRSAALLLLSAALATSARAQWTGFEANLHGFKATGESYDSQNLGGHFSVPGGTGIGGSLGLGSQEVLFTVGFETLGGQRETVNGSPNGRTARTQDVNFGLRLSFGSAHSRTFPWVWGEIGQRTLTDDSRTLNGATLSMRVGLKYQLSGAVGLNVAARVGLSEYTRLHPRGADPIDIATPRAGFARLELGIDYRPFFKVASPE